MMVLLEGIKFTLVNYLKIKMLNPIDSKIDDFIYG